MTDRDILTAQAFNPRFLNLILFPTEKCNFRCTYCYEDFKLGKMKPWVINAIKELISNRINDLTRLEISWFGGEPLIAKNIVLDISRFIVENAKKYNPDLDYRSNMTTNAYYLNRELFESLVVNGIVDFQISLDGPKRIHDLSRVMINGKGTFDSIWKNLLDIRNSSKKANIILRIHFDMSNFNYLEELIDQLDVEFGEDDRFNFYFKTIDKLGGENDDKLQTIPFNKKDTYKDILRHNTKAKERLFELSEKLPYVCYASKPNSIGIRSDGSLIKCTVGLNHESNQIGKINPDGTLSIHNENMRKWIIGFDDFDLSTLACPYFKMSGVGELK
ncbi:radical SAM protein [Winogradskyella haliclonae]|uniref:Radical SAM core domain-containing protein n=1 Tax=Winogradskyella haliclonae TaxID=2048558 RepID=A0ABQ2C140_9FLAO|nr:radical SAM protein [Winogradskyella haliclonae]GGI58450.1 hypothetical protein GCM10011444_27590 [Winogradskyella haliclonae]